MQTVSQLRDMAAPCREFAALAKTEEVREQLLEVADRFERVAKDRLSILQAASHNLGSPFGS